MSSLPIESINTKLEAYKLIHDSSRLFKLLYSKYGEIEDEYIKNHYIPVIFKNFLEDITEKKNLKIDYQN